MSPSDRYAKTAKGQEEITARRSNLRGKLRTMLILTDPSKSAAELCDQGARIGVDPSFLDILASGGYIAPIGAPPQPSAQPAIDAQSAPQQVTQDELARFRAAKAFMNETVVQLLGLRAFMFTLRLERCATRSELADLVPDYDRALRKVSAEPEARLMVDRLRELLV